MTFKHILQTIFLLSFCSMEIGCSDSKANLKTGEYTIVSDCSGSTESGKITLSESTPNVYELDDATQFGFPVPRMTRGFQGKLYSENEQRSCRGIAYGNEKSVMFSCFNLSSESIECTALIEKI